MTCVLAGRGLCVVLQSILHLKLYKVKGTGKGWIGGHSEFSFTKCWQGECLISSQVVPCWTCIC